MKKIESMVAYEYEYLSYETIIFPLIESNFHVNTNLLSSVREVLPLFFFLFITLYRRESLRNFARVTKFIIQTQV